jgi:hypothetical protein
MDGVVAKEPKTDFAGEEVVRAIGFSYLEHNQNLGKVFAILNR